MIRSLRRQLLAWVLLPVVGAIAVDIWLTYKTSLATASVVQDQLLLGSARMIAEQVSFEDGSFQHQIPPAALELFQSPDPDRIYYRVTTGDGQMLAGYTDLLLRKPPSSQDTPYYFGAKMRDEDVRAVTVMQPVIGNPSAQPVVVEVAQTMFGHTALAKRIWFQTIRQQLLILAIATVFILFGLRRGLQPLVRLRNDVLARREGSLGRLETYGIPAELTPLVDAFNDYMQRLENYTTHRSVFTQNAAHQLRTPLTVLNTQISDAMRAESQTERESALTNARQTLQQTTRLVNQFLTLSSAEASNSELEPISTQIFVDLIQKVLETLALSAHNKHIDLGFERSGADTIVLSNPDSFREIATNVIDNAIRYTPAHGVVTVRVHSSLQGTIFSVEDNGIGVPVAHLEKIFERFHRIDASSAAPGNGLGLAIVKELATQSGARAHAENPTSGKNGLIVTIHFPRANTGIDIACR